MGLRCLLLEGSWSAAERPRSRLHHGVMSFALGFWGWEEIQAFELFKSACTSRTGEIRDPSPVIPLETLKSNNPMISISHYNVRKRITPHCFPCSCQGNWWWEAPQKDAVTPKIQFHVPRGLRIQNWELKTRWCSIRTELIWKFSS